MSAVSPEVKKHVPSAGLFQLFNFVAFGSLVTFVGSSYVLLGSQHRWKLNQSHGERYLNKYNFTEVQLYALSSLVVSIVLLLGFTGVSFANQTTETASSKTGNKLAGFSFGEWICFLSTLGCIFYNTFNVATGLEQFFANGMNFPDPVGLFTGIASVGIGQVLVITYHYIRCEHLNSNEKMVATSGKDGTIQLKPILYHENGFLAELKEHFSREEAFILLLPYLSLTWMFNLMPASYYDMDSAIEWHKVAFKLLIVDYFTFSNHVTEHRIPEIYKHGHKPHHKFKNPQLFNAFNGSLMDTIALILLPLFTSAHLVHLNTWSYVVFGTVYASYFMMIHSEFPHFFDPLFRAIGIYTAEDHHVHHALFVFNYSHFFTYFDRLFGTYRSGKTIKTFRRFSLDEPKSKKLN